MDLFAIWRRRIFAVLALMVVVRVAFMCALPLLDPSECRYAVMASNMGLTGDFLVPRFVHDGIYQSFDGKPPLYFQMGGFFTWLFGANEFAVRLPSLLCAILSCLLIYGAMVRIASRRVALAAVLVTAGSTVFYLFSGFAMTDMPLVLAITGAVYSYCLFDAVAPSREKWAYSVAFWSFLGLGMLAKGPVALVLSGLGIFIYVAWFKRWSDLKYHSWIVGPLCFLLIAAPWYVMMARSNPDFLEYFFINENFKRFLFKDYGDRYGSGHETFLGMSVIWTLLVLFPTLALSWILLAKRSWKHWLRRFVAYTREERTGALLLCAIVAITGFWCLTSRSLIYYFLAVPALFGGYLALQMQRHEMLNRKTFWKWATIVALFTAIAGNFGDAAVKLEATYIGEKATRELAKEARTIKAQHPEYAEIPFYFATRTPYSAEFYWERRHSSDPQVVRHAKENIKISMEASRDKLLVISDRNYRKLKPEDFAKRQLLVRRAEWRIYAPEQQEAEKSAKN